MYKPGDHGSTFGGNPLGCAIARTALRVLIEEKMVERSAELGAYFLTLLQTLRSPDLKEVRGKGLWIGIELHSPARPYCEALKEEGILCKETHDRVIRIAPPSSSAARKLTGPSSESRKSFRHIESVTTDWISTKS